MELLALSDFKPHVGTTFTIRGPDGLKTELALLSASKIETSSRTSLPGDRPFSLVFRGPNQHPIGQGTHPLVHPGLGQVDLFLVPIQPDAEGPLYEAIFS